jgi:hypothetical protein
LVRRSLFGRFARETSSSKTVAGPGRNSPTPVPRQTHLSREWLRACGVGRPLAPPRASVRAGGPAIQATRERFETADHAAGCPWRGGPASSRAPCPVPMAFRRAGEGRLPRAGPGDRAAAVVATLW